MRKKEKKKGKHRTSPVSQLVIHSMQIRKRQTNFDPVRYYISGTYLFIKLINFPWETQASLAVCYTNELQFSAIVCEDQEKAKQQLQIILWP